MDTKNDLREQASEHYRRVEESFARCDTDGFLSQWANGLAGQRLNYEADIAEQGGAYFPALFHGERRVNAKAVDGKYGRVWLLADSEEARYGRRFIPLGDNSRVQRDYGLHEVTELVPAKAIITGSGTGLSGSAWVEIIRTDMFDWNTNDL